MRIVTLTTDFGTDDHDAGVLTGVIWKIAPEVQVVHLTHEIERHNILQGALTLQRCTPFFPEGSIHVAVVDPGVGTARRALAARLGNQFFVAPDNGLITLVLQRAQSAGNPVEIVSLNKPEYWLPEVSQIFHGRDLFAPVAAHMAQGVPLSALGDPLPNPVLLDIPVPQSVPGGWSGQVIHVDNFGNLSTNIHKDLLKGQRDVQVNIGTTTLTGLVRAFGDGDPGELVALIDSSGYLSIAVVNGSASKRLNARIGMGVMVQIPAK